MQDKRVSRIEAGHSDKHRPAVPVSFFSLLLKKASVRTSVITTTNLTNYTEPWCYSHCYRKK